MRRKPKQRTSESRRTWSATGTPVRFGRHPEQQTDHQVVGEDRAAPIADKWQCDSSDGNDPQGSSEDHDRLEAQRDPEPRCKQHPEVRARPERDTKRAMDQGEIEPNGGECPEQAKLL